MISLLVRVNYQDPKYPGLKTTHHNVIVEDTAPLREAPRRARRAVEEWARDLHYTPIDWKIVSINLGRSDFFAGTF